MGSGINRRRGAAAVSSVGALLAMVGLVAVAGGALKTKSATSSIPALDEGEVTAKCKKSREAVSIGFSALPFDLDFTEASNFLIATQREGKRKATASAANFGAAGGFTSIAYCEKPKPKLKKKSATTTLEADEIDSIAAKCPKGTVAVSGGSAVSAFDRDAGPEIYTISSHRDGRREWVVTGHNFGPTSAPGELTAFAYCDDSKPRLKEKSATTPVDANYAELATATAKCGKGKSAVSGGFESPDYGPSFLTDPQPYPLESQRAGKRKWTASGANNSNSVAGDLVVYAYCEEK